MGWNFAVQAARYCDTWLVCERHKWFADIRRYLETHGEIPGLRFVFVPERAWGALAWRIPWVGYLSYNLWHRRAFRIARQLHRHVRFDLVHQVNILGYREPGYLWKLGIPFVWGPVGGTQNYPWRFLGEAGIRGAISEAVRSLLNRIQLRFSRRVRRASREAAVMMTASSTGKRDFTRGHGAAPVLFLDIGITGLTSQPPVRRRDGNPLRILWCGAFQPWKALSLLIKALARLPKDLQYELRVVGDGPLRRRYRRMAQKMGIDRRITWLGQLPHCDALKQYQWADVFAFTSLRDTSGTVVLEAFGAGVPVICLDHQGVHDMVTDRCGIKIPVTTPREVISRLGDAIVSLAADGALRRRLSQGALERAKEYLWSERGEQVAAIYQQVTGGLSRQTGKESIHA